MNPILPLLATLALILGIVAAALSIYNVSKMTQQIKSGSQGWGNLTPVMGFALPGSLTASGEVFRSRGSSWMCAAVIPVAAARAHKPSLVVERRRALEVLGQGSWVNPWGLSPSVF